MAEQISETNETSAQRLERWRLHLSGVIQGYAKLDVALALQAAREAAAAYASLAALEDPEARAAAVAGVRRAERIATVRECVAVVQDWEHVEVNADGERTVMDCGDLPDRLLALIGEGPYAPQPTSALPNFQPIDCGF